MNKSELEKAIALIWTYIDEVDEDVSEAMKIITDRIVTLETAIHSAIDEFDGDDGVTITNMKGILTKALTGGEPIEHTSCEGCRYVDEEEELEQQIKIDSEHSDLGE